MATGSSDEYNRLLAELTCGGPVEPRTFIEALEHILKRLGPPEDEASLEKAGQQVLASQPVT